MDPAFAAAVPHLDDCAGHQIIGTNTGLPEGGPAPARHMDLRKKNLILTGVILVIVIGLYVFSIVKVISSTTPS